jgi:hypothetical protein
MPYIRYDINCIKSSVQPNKSQAVDAYGNSFDNWCADYQKHDVSNSAIGSAGCVALKQDAGKIPTIPYIAIIPLWEARYVDNSTRKPQQYEHNVTVFDAYIPTVATPFLVEENDVFVEILVDGVPYQMITEDGYSLRYEVNTDIVLTNSTTVVNTEDNGSTIQTSSGYELSIE